MENGTTINRPFPQPVTGLSEVIAVSGGQSHSLALGGNGKIWAWGGNANGQVGIGNTVNQPAPVQLAGVSNVIAVSAGHEHSLALTADGFAFAWGLNGDGRLGIGNNSAKDSPTKVIGLGNPASALANVVEISAGSTHSLFRLADGSVRACGNNSFGQLGHSTTPPTRPQVTNITNVIAIQASTDFSAALKSDGTLWCWGLNTDGQLGNGQITNSTVPVQVTGLGNVIGFAGGSRYQAVLTADGRIRTWGANDGFQLGNGTALPSLVPAEISPIAPDTTIRWKQVKSGEYFNVALKTDGTVWAWGNNTYGQLGNGTTAQSAIPVKVDGLKDVKAVAAGWNHGLAIKADGTVWAWGENTMGQLGDGSTFHRNKPVSVFGMSGVTGLAGGHAHSVAVNGNGLMWAWGYNSYGQLGNGFFEQSRTVPVPVSGLSNGVAAVTGSVHTMALLGNGTVQSWGYGADGQLGTGNSSNRNVPGPVSALSSVSRIEASSGWHSMARTAAGAIFGWGYNSQGQIGDGSTNARTSPVSISLAKTVSALTIYRYHSLAVSCDGTAFAWGNNNVSQLGDGTTVQRRTPVPIPGLVGVKSLAAGSDHSLALKADGTIWAWGGNTSNQLGDGTIIKRFLPSAPEDVIFPGPVSTPGNEMNTLSMQIRIRNVDPAFTVTTSAPCGIPPGTDRLWNKSSLVTIPDGIVLIFGEGLLFETVLPFTKLRFSQLLPSGAVVEIFDVDRNTVVTTKTIP